MISFLVISLPKLFNNRIIVGPGIFQLLTAGYLLPSGKTFEKFNPAFSLLSVISKY
jgi:hypothetical protein